MQKAAPAQARDKTAESARKRVRPSGRHALAKASSQKRSRLPRWQRGGLAITSLACRLPGAPDIDAFWRLLIEGRDAITAVPEDRWSAIAFDRPGAPMRGRAYTRAAGVIDELWEFDAAHFGISPREAEQMDPQQRMMLEIGWQALEQALPLGGALGSMGALGGLGRVGVYVGASTMDHAQRFASDIASIDTPFMTGNTLSVIANRLSHVFGFEGPSLTVDTACASSLTALHLAAEALRRGEIDAAIVGGVNALLQPWPFVGFSQATMLSPTGLCRSFDASADGYVRGEGAVALVLRRLEDAEAGGEPVKAVLIGTGIGSDGRKAGLSRPDATRQAALIRQVHRRAGLPAAALSFVEAHGTGTPVGDPVEAEALASVFGPARAGAGAPPLPIGSAKSNVGHLEPAAGLVGVAKTVLSLMHEVLPATLHVASVNPEVERHAALAVARCAVPLACDADTPAAAAVSAFGFGGANAHAVLRAAPARVCVSQPLGVERESASLPPLVLTADSASQLAALAAAWRDRVADGEHAEEVRDGQVSTESDLQDLVAAAGQRLAYRTERAVIVADDRNSLVDGLAKLAQSDPGQGVQDVVRGERRAFVIRNRAESTTANPVLRAEPFEADTTDRSAPQGGLSVSFLFSGNGAQWAGMGEALFGTNAAYTDAFERASSALVEAGGDDPRILRTASDLGERLQESGPAQAFLFALQVGLVEALGAAGLRPGAVLGHSVGEVAAAWACSALSLEDAARIIALRAKAVAPLQGTGGMAALLATPERAQTVIDAAGLAEEVVIAAHNSRRSVTLSGSNKGIDAIMSAARTERLACRRLPVAFPYHAPPIEAIREELLNGLVGLTPGAPCCPFFSTVTGSLAAAPDNAHPPLGAEHWWRNAREPVLFAEAATAMLEVRPGPMLEIGPRPVLAGYVKGLETTDTLPTVFSAMEAPDRPSRPIEAVVGTLLAVGAAVANDFLGPVRPAPSTGVPPLPLDRRAYRAALSSEAIDLFGIAGTPDERLHPLLGRRDRPGTGPWHALLDPSTLPWLEEHKVDGNAVLPAMAFAEIGLAAGRALHGKVPLELRDLDILSPLAIRLGGTMVRTSVQSSDGALSIQSRPLGADTAWQLHARAVIRPLDGPLSSAADIASSENPFGAVTDGRSLYEDLATMGLDYGPSFRRVRRIKIPQPAAGAPDSGPPVTGFAHLSEQERADAAHATWCCDPMLLDAVLHGIAPISQAASAALSRSDMSQIGPSRRSCHLPVRIARIQVDLGESDGEASKAGATARLTLVHSSRHRMVADAQLRLGSGADVLLEGICLEPRRNHVDAPLEDWEERLCPVDRSHEPRLPMCLRTVAPSDAPPRSDAERILSALGASAHEPEEPDSCVLLDEIAAASSRDDTLERGAANDENASDRRPASLAQTVPALLRRAPQLGQELMSALQADPAVEPNNVLASARLPNSDAANESVWQAFAALVEPPRHNNERLGVLTIGAPTTAFLTHLARHGDPQRSAVVSSGKHRQGGALHRFHSSVGTSLMREGFGDLRPTERRDEVDRDLPFTAAASMDPKAAFDLVLISLRPGEANNFVPTGSSEPVAALESRSELSDAIDRMKPGGWLVATVVPVTSPSRDRSEIAASAKALHTHLLRAGLTEVACGFRQTATGAAAMIVARRVQQASSLQKAERLAESPVHSISGQSDDGVCVRDEAPSFAILHDPGPEAQAAAQKLATELGRARIEPLPGGGSPSSATHFVIMPPSSRPAQPNETEFDTGEARQLLSRRLEALRRLALMQNSEAREAEAALPDSSFADAAGEVDGRSCISYVIVLSDAETAPNCGVGRRRMRALGRRDTSGIASAGLEGLVRTVCNELPRLRVRHIRLSEDVAEKEVAKHLRDAAVLAAVPSATAQRDGKLAAPVVHRRSILPHGNALKLEQRRRGAIDSLEWQPVFSRSPKPGEMLIRVEATGLNFRDVMWAQGLLSAETMETGFAGATLGMECSGTIEAVGGDEAEFTQGTPVLAFASAAFATHVTVDRRAVFPIPADISIEQAAGLPVAAFTARYALSEVARIEAGETVLIHGAAGGVGLAAIQEAMLRGAHVIATAGRPAKRRLLQALGVEHVLSSRDGSFARDLMEITGGRGCDVILNTLSGLQLARSLECLAPFGRFVEIGKQDLYGHGRATLRPLARNGSFHVVDADQLMAARPDLVHRLVSSWLDDRAAGRLGPPSPYTVFSAENAIDAFRLLQSAGHLGKVIVRSPLNALQEIGCAKGSAGRSGQVERGVGHTRRARQVSTRAGANLSPNPSQPSLAGCIDARGEWLILGGTGGIGLALAERLAHRGARRLWLVSRQGGNQLSIERVRARLEKFGTELRVHSADGSDLNAMTALMREIESSARPAGASALTGVVHAAMQLDDAPLATLTAERVDPVLKAKIDAAMVLDRITRHLKLEHFVLIGSIAARIGNPGQAAYAAANAALDGLAKTRHGEGLPALSIALGPVGDVGHLAGDDTLSKRVARQAEQALGAPLLPIDDVLDTIELLLDDPTGSPVRAIMPASSGLRSGVLPIADSNMFFPVRLKPLGDETTGESFAEAKEVASQLRVLPRAERLKRLERLLTSEVGRILRLPIADIAPHRPVADLGLDSLMAMDLRTTLADEYRLPVPATALEAATSIADLSAAISAALGDEKNVRSSETASAKLPGDIQQSENKPTQNAASVNSKEADNRAARKNETEHRATDTAELVAILSLLHGASLEGATTAQLAQQDPGAADPLKNADGSDVPRLSAGALRPLQASGG
ncbi:MAG: type I polyketide synthase [Pseudomonadota bacterium]